MPIFQLSLSLAALVPAFLCVNLTTAQAQQTDGERVFRTRCESCHTLEDGTNRVGPHLAGIIGRSAGSVEGARYSKALQASGIVWDENTLDAYLRNPRQFVSGTTMTVALPNAADRAAVIAYLVGSPRRTD